LAGALASALAQRKKKVAESGESELGPVCDAGLTFSQMMRAMMMIGSLESPKTRGVTGLMEQDTQPHCYYLQLGLDPVRRIS
jgi:hypothetical protein